jgi:polyhydroxyalkanoate synthesis repressor PhaR
MTDTILLKKYGNRRLYDTEKSRYVTLDEVSEMIKKGDIVEVSDAQTKEDVTAFVLTQIILEEAKKKNFFLPVPVLHLIIRYGDNILGEFINNYLQKTIQNYLEFKTAFDEQMKKWLGAGMNLSDFISKSSDLQPPFSGMMNFFSPPEKPGESEPAKSQKTATANTDSKKILNSIRSKK